MHPRSKPDYYAIKAQKEKYRARSAYKLKEAIEQFGLVRKGNRVLDLGSAPGSWLQVAAVEVGGKGRVVGVDIRSVPPPLPQQVLSIVGDILSPETATRIRETESQFDLVLSDLAPSTSGVKDVDAERSLELITGAWNLARVLLVPGGNFMGKVFEGPGVQSFRKELSSHFKTVRVFKPRSSRKESREVYLVGLHRK